MLVNFEDMIAKLPEMTEKETTHTGKEMERALMSWGTTLAGLIYV